MAFTLILVLVLAAHAAAAPPPRADINAASWSTAASAQHVVRAAQQLSVDASIPAALTSVGVSLTDSDRIIADSPPAAEQALASFGFETALDLHLLAGGPEAAELMAELRTGTKLSIADRAKIRLLVGDRDHLARVLLTPLSSSSDELADVDHLGQGEQPQVSWRRQLQEDRDTLSTDTIAVVFSVFIGVCGYLVQAWTSHKAQRHAAELQREHDKEARDRQAEQERAQAQIRRTERWVDDCCMPINRTLSVYGLNRMRFGEYCCVSFLILVMLAEPV
eukprot:SAG31_NODE_3830_length_3842_cov_2.970345_3_plen_278_part_00